MDIAIRFASDDDVADLTNIYNHYISNTHVTFETDRVTLPDMADRIAKTRAIPLPWLVAEATGTILGYAYASKWKGRCAYRFSIESTIYLDPKQTEKGVGSQLYSALIEAIRESSMRSIIGGIALPNDRSVKFHERFGFRKVGHFEQVGYKFGRWIDVGYWQLLL